MQAPLEVLPNALHDKFTRGQQPCLVDVRSAFEFSNGHPPGAISIPAALISEMEIRRRLGDEAGRKRPLYLISANGDRARQAAGKLQAEGLPQVLLVRGGTTAWSEDYRLL
jgi:rhodanese-related sulfurtransferase